MVNSWKFMFVLASLDEQFLGGGAGGGEDAEEVDSLWEGRDVEGVVCVDG